MTNPYRQPDRWLVETLKKANRVFEQTRNQLQQLLDEYTGILRIMYANRASPGLPDISAYIKELYNGIDRFNVVTYQKTADSLYTEAWVMAGRVKNLTENRKNVLDMVWLTGILAAFNPVTKYAYTDEVTDKEEYFERQLRNTLKAQLATNRKLSVFTADASAVFKQSKQLWHNMADSTLAFVGTQAMIKAYKDAGIKSVIFHTEEDEKVCKKCAPLNGKITEMDELIIGINAPPIHHSCRCWLEPIE